jgi:TolB-like protein
MMIAATALPRRQTAAVLCADVHGYTRLMSRDELGTYDRVTRSIALIRALIGDYGGMIVQTAGDGVLALFESATMALRFAVEIQREFRNDAIWAEGEPISFRIGINCGEVLVGEANIQGHSVNIAARIQALATPGGICISASVREAVDASLNVHVRPLGRRLLKNIDEPVELFAVEINGAHQVNILPIVTPQQMLAVDEPSVAVLPLSNLTTDPRDRHLCDGITGDIITNLSRFRDLLVIAHQSTARFRAVDIPLVDTAERLGVRYVATGTLQRDGRRVRLKVELAEVESQRVLWSERYTGSLRDIFAFQDDVASTIAARLAIQITTTERQRMTTHVPEELRAYGMILRGQEMSQHLQRPTNLHARRLFEQAAELDPHYARSYAGMSRTFNLAWRYRWETPHEVALERALQLAQAAIEHDEFDARGYSELGYSSLFKRRPEAALAAYERAIELNPNDPDILAEMGMSVRGSGDPQRAVELVQRAMRLNPFYPDTYLWILGDAYFDLADYRSAVDVLSRMRDKSEGLRLLTASYALLGDLDEARRHAGLLLQAHPEFLIEHWEAVPPDPASEATQRFVEGLKRAGLK